MFASLSLKKVATIGVFLLVALTLVYLLTSPRLPSTRIMFGAKNDCLQDNKVATFAVTGETGQSTGTIAIQVTDKRTDKIISGFSEHLVQPGHYHPAELHNCGAYFVRGFNHDPKSLEQKAGFRAELWKYSYKGVGESLFLTSEVTESGFISYLSRDFRVDTNEKYITFHTGYAGQSDYALIIKDLETRNDVFKLPLTELLEIDEQFAGSFGFQEWTDDSRYFWTSLYDGAYVKGWVRIDTNDWSYEAFPAPPDRTLNGYPLHTESGWVPFMPGGVWTGMDIVEEQVSRDRAERGETLDLYLYNIYTKEEILVVDTEATSWVDVGTEWIDDKTLQYKLPNGETTTFTLPN